MALLSTHRPQGLCGAARLRRLWPVLLILAGLAATESPAQPVPSREYQIKAVFLFNFIQFVEWPETAFPTYDAPVRIGILGDDPFGQSMEATIKGETIRNRRLVVERSHRLEDLRDCHLIFFCKSESRQMREILAQLDGRPVLTVSETDGFARLGGVIAFYPDGKKVRFEINSETAQRAGLKMSSQLLELGKIVTAETPKGGS
jgi:hypothetical protein